jgi:ABC-type polysaccharide/polyol phosphate transport system ATPase subunit
MNASIDARDVGIRFLFDHERRVVTPTLARLRRKGSETWGLQGLNLSVGRGEGIALVGRSGSGKTTFLRALAGVLAPDKGELEVRGRVASLLSVDAGLMSVLTGRENALLRAALAGIPRAQARARLEEVKERTGLTSYFERPASSYSQGMRARLGFVVAEQADPEILLLDEVHEALDHDFRRIVADRAHAIIDAGGIVVAAGHDHEMLRRLCNRAVWLEHGSLRAEGEFEQVRAAYLEAA